MSEPFSKRYESVRFVPTTDPSSWTFEVPLRLVGASVAVCMAPVERRFGSLELPEEVASVRSPDFGAVAASKVSDLPVGSLVMVRPYDGLWIDSRDYPWVPEGRQLRLYGVTSDWRDSIEAIWTP